MQLPRGSFRGIRKSVPLKTLLAELSHEKFSGACSISSQHFTCTLVFQRGVCFLAQCQNHVGNSAWIEIQKKGELEVDAAISALDEAQITLSLEFNKNSHVVKGAATPPQTPAITHKSPPSPVRQQVQARPVPPARPVYSAIPIRNSRPAAPVKKEDPEAASRQARKPRPGPAVQAPHLPASRTSVMDLSPQQVHETGLRKPESEHAAASGTAHKTSFDHDIDTLDTMDMSNVTEKLRNDCRIIVRQLHLEHLMEK